MDPWHASRGLSTPRRSAVPPSSSPAVTAASARGCTARPRSRCSTRSTTPTATAGLARVTSASCGSSASTPVPRQNGITYNRFIQGLKAAGVEVDRKILAELAVTDPAAFAALVELAKAALPGRRERSGRGPGLSAEHSRTTTRGRSVHRTDSPGRCRSAPDEAPGPERAERFLVEGAQAVREALAWPGRMHELFVTAHGRVPQPRADPRRGRRWRAGSARSPSRPPRRCPRPSRRRASSRCATSSTRPLDEALRGTPRLVAVLVGVADPGNAGTVVRVADAAGADAVIFAGDTVDPHNGKCVRASTGSRLPPADRTVP